VLGMYSFNERMKSAVSDPGTKGINLCFPTSWLYYLLFTRYSGWLVAILELGAWFGVLCTGQLADRLGRKRTILLAVVVFVIGVIVQTAAFKPSSIFGGECVIEQLV
jgi:MFS family permease